MNKSHWNGQAYAQIGSPQYQINSEFLSLHQFVGTEHILDIGCGDGKTTHLLASKVQNGRVLAIDASESMLLTANKNKQSKHIQFKLLNAEDIQFTQQFDIVTSFFCMQWVPNKKKTIAQIYKSLKAGGRFLMVTPLPHPHLPSIRNKIIQSAQWQQYFTDYQDPLIHINDTHYETYFKESGFSKINYQLYPSPLKMRNYVH